MDLKRKLVIGALCAAALFGGGYGAGRSSRPALSLEKKGEKSTSIDATKTIAKTASAEAMKNVQDTGAKTDKVRTTKKVFGCDGKLLSETTTERDRTEATKHQEEAKQASKSVESVTDKIGYRDVQKWSEKLVINIAKPDWIVSVDAGVSLPGLLQGKDIGGLKIKIPGGVFGVTVDRRIIGTWYLGIWANSAAMGGVRVTKTF